MELSKLTELTQNLIREVKIVEEMNASLLKQLEKYQKQEAELFDKIEKLQIDVHSFKVAEKQKEKKEKAKKSIEENEIDYQDIMRDYLARKNRKIVI